MFKFVLPGLIALAGISHGALAGDATVAKGDDSKLTDESLGKIIDNMGYEARVSTYKTGKTFSFKYVGKDLDYPVTIELSKSKRFLWITVNLRKVKPEYLKDSAKLHGLLRMNARVAFRLETTKTMFRAAYGLPNHHMDAKIIRFHLRDMINELDRSRDVWDASRWGTLKSNLAKN